MLPGKQMSTSQIPCYQMKCFKVRPSGGSGINVQLFWFCFYSSYFHHSLEFRIIVQMKTQKRVLKNFEHLFLLLSFSPSQRPFLVLFAQLSTLLVSWDVSSSIWSLVWGSITSYRKAPRSSSKTSLTKSALTASLSGQCVLQQHIETSSFKSPPL